MASIIHKNALQWLMSFIVVLGAVVFPAIGAIAQSIDPLPSCIDIIFFLVYI